MENHAEQTNLTPTEAQTGADSSSALMQQAFTLYQCKDGSLVRNPQECTKLPGASSVQQFLPAAHVG
jgi:hypothetical protein